MKLTITSWDAAKKTRKVDGTVEIGPDGKLIVSEWAQQFVDHYTRQLTSENGKPPSPEELLKAMCFRMENGTMVSATLGDPQRSPHDALIDSED